MTLCGVYNLRLSLKAQKGLHLKLSSEDPAIHIMLKPVSLLR